MYTIMPTDNIIAQKNWVNWILINVIPIDMRKITREARYIKRNILPDLDVYLYQIRSEFNNRDFKRETATFTGNVNCYAITVGLLASPVVEMNEMGRIW
jgi:hypothetical protein